MVARFGLGAKNSPPREPRRSDVLPPPPPYDLKGSSSAPVLVSETTTTTTEVVTTTTQTTTHFFSLPLWRRRVNPVSVAIPRGHFGIDVDEHGVAGPSNHSSPFMVEKDLPPTPPADMESPASYEPDISLPRTEDPDAHSAMEATPSYPARRTSKPGAQPRSQSTFVLAHASLGLGLPHVMPHASASSSSSEVNTVAFIPAIPPAQESRYPAHTIRRAKSSAKLNASSENPFIGEDVGNKTWRRTRGLSLSTTAFLNFGSDVKGKGKETDDAPSTPPSPKVLTRKSSFWSRRKGRPSTEIPALLQPRDPAAELHLPPLPVVPPISPFNMDLRSSSTPSAFVQHARGLSRSLSERTNPSTPSNEVSPDTTYNVLLPLPLPKHKPPSRRVRRPATADSTTHTQPRSLFIDDPPNHTVSPLPSPPPSVRERVSISSTQARPRSKTNPPLLNRLSVGLFTSSPSPSPQPNISLRDSLTIPSSPVATSTDSIRQAANISPAKIPKPIKDGESPEVYLKRLLDAINKAEVAAVLASSNDPFHVRALRAYIDQFNFIDDPLDVALRKLLMHVGLPRETQQIDRVMEAFASKYVQCNPDLYVSEDHPYILAFSLIMLHTDAFNRSNKRKMTKADYIKNTRLPGVPSEVLDCFYDNIVFAPFIFIEDPLDVNGQRGLIPDGATSRLSAISGSGGSSNNSSGVTLLGKGGKVDPYYLIAHDLLGPLRVDVKSYVPLENPFSYKITADPWDDDELLNAFAKATVIEMGALGEPRASPFFSLSVPGTSSPFAGQMTGFMDIFPVSDEFWTIKVTKSGLLNRKDDILEGGRKASNRKWKLWSAILTGSQLLMFRDPSWATMSAQESGISGGPALYQPTSIFKPDELLSVKDAIAVFDASYTKYDNTFRFVVPDGRQFLLQASDSHELHEWISRINYASAFKSAGVRMRPLGMSGKDVELTGVAAAASHLHDIHLKQSAAARVRSWDGNAPMDIVDMLSGGTSTAAPSRPRAKRRVTIISGRDDMDLEVPVAPEVEGADQLKATFDEVKAALATGRLADPEESSFTPISVPPPQRTESADSILAVSPVSGGSIHSGLPSRSEIIQSKVQDLESKIAVAQSQLESDMRFIRNIATLTPFQRTTRNRLHVAAQNVAKRITQVRLDVTKLICHRDVLAGDLAAESRDRRRATQLAFKAATDTLQSRLEAPVPGMTLALPGQAAESQQSPVPEGASSLRRVESSICESFHSAIDFGPEWPSSPDEMDSSTFLSASNLFENSQNSSTSLGSFMDPDTPSSRKGSVSPSRSRSSNELQGHERFYTAAEEAPEEEAEDWNRTRAAKRVSLVRLPSDIRMTSLFERHGSRRYRMEAV